MSTNQRKLTTNDLNSIQLHLIEEAKNMTKVAYAPYSNFFVGAAVELEDGRIFLGCNQENASYPLCICGERVALYNAYANAPGVAINTLVVTAVNPAKKLMEPVSPCGACRQVIKEFEVIQNKKMEIILTCESDQVMIFDGIELLLPFSFSKDALK